MKIPMIAVLLGLMAWMPTVRCLADESAQPSTQPGTELSAEELAFQRTLTGAQLFGRFTLDGDARADHQDQYDIVSARKLKGDLWLLESRIRYGKHDLTVPLVLPVKWAGDTPIICVTDVGVPGLGTYTARVMIYDDHYAGTWSGGATHRGTLAGRITHPATQPTDDAAAPAKP